MTVERPEIDVAWAEVSRLEAVLRRIAENRLTHRGCVDLAAAAVGEPDSREPSS